MSWPSEINVRLEFLIHDFAASKYDFLPSDKFANFSLHDRICTMPRISFVSKRNEHRFLLAVNSGCCSFDSIDRNSMNAMKNVFAA